jgi:hypothetical protein
MEFLLIGGVLLLVAKLARPSAPPAPPLPAPPPVHQPPAAGGRPNVPGLIRDVVTGAAGLAGVGATAATLAGAKVFGEAFAAAELDKFLLGDKGDGAVEGLFKGDLSHVNPAIAATEYATVVTQTSGGGFVAGAGVVAGRFTGRELDKAFGGTGEGATGTVAQVGGGVAGFVGSMCGTLALASVAVYTVLAYAIASIVDDLNRLSYGQAGARKDFDQEWDRVETEFETKMLGLTAQPDGSVTQSPTGLTRAEAIRMAWPYADGYMKKRNRLAFAAWMCRGRGFLGLGTTDNIYHAEFGMDRGYFLGEVAHGFFLTDPLERSLTPEYSLKAAIPRGELRSFTHRDVVDYTYEWQDNPARFPSDGPGLGVNTHSASTCAVWKSQGKGVNDSLYKSTCMQRVGKPVYETRSYLSDPVRLQWIEFGECSANMAAYFEWMRNGNRGAGVGDEGHFEYGRTTMGLFEGFSDGPHAYEQQADGSLVEKEDGPIRRGGMLRAKGLTKITVTIGGSPFPFIAFTFGDVVYDWVTGGQTKLKFVVVNVAPAPMAAPVGPATLQPIAFTAASTPATAASTPATAAASTSPAGLGPAPSSPAPSSALVAPSPLPPPPPAPVVAPTGLLASSASSALVTHRIAPPVGPGSISRRLL